MIFSMCLFVFSFRWRVHRTCVQPWKHRFIAHLKASSSFRSNGEIADFLIWQIVGDSMQETTVGFCWLILINICRTETDSLVVRFITDLSLYTVDVTLKSPKLLVLFMPKTSPLSVQQNLLMSFICCFVYIVTTGLDIPCRCLTLRHYDRDMVNPGIKEGGMLRLRCSVLTAFSQTNWIIIMSWIQT